jgi:hypothetical protein
MKVAIVSIRFQEMRLRGREAGLALEGLLALDLRECQARPVRSDHAGPCGGRKEAAMNEAALRKSLSELSEVLAFPHRRGEVQDTSAQASDLIGATLEETLDYLRLQVKYLVFDLEATRRENMYLRRMLEGRRRDPDESGPMTG